MKSHSLIVSFVLLLSSSASYAESDEFVFYDLTVTVVNGSGQPVQDAFVKAYSMDWPVAYPLSWYLMTDSAGQCVFHIPRGKWKIVAGKDLTPGVFVFETVLLEGSMAVRLEPDHVVEVNVSDRIGHELNTAVIYAGPSSLVPNCLMPVCGWTQNGTCAIQTNADEDLTFFIIRQPTKQWEGYFLFVEGCSADEDTVIDASSMTLNHIHFDGRKPDDTPGTISWILCFPHQDVERLWGHTDIWLDGEGDAFLNVDFLNYQTRSRPWSEELQDDIWYYFQYRSIDFTDTKSVSLTVGGPIIPAFHFLPSPFGSNVSMFMFGPAYDAHGNELRYHAPNTAERLSIPLTIWEYEGGPILYDDVLTIDSDNLSFMIYQSFPDTAVFRVECNQPGYGGVQVIEGSLYDPDYLYQYHDVSTPHFEIHAPEWMPDKAEQLGVHWEQAYDIMVGLLGSEPPLTPEKNFYIHPCGTWASSNGQELFYHGFTWWQPQNPAMWEDIAFHEIGHRMESELFNQPLHPFPFEQHMNEGVAEMLSHYTIAQSHGPEFARLYLNERMHRFLAYMDDPDTAPYETWHNLFFFLEVYLPRSCSWEINKQFFRNWIEACMTLNPLGYRQEEIVAALYSVLAGEDASWMFGLCGFTLDKQRVHDAVSQISYLGPEIVNFKYLSQLGGFWHTTDCDQLQDCYYADWYVDRTIDILDLGMLADYWLSDRMGRIFP